MPRSLRRYLARVLLWFPLLLIVGWAVNRERIDYLDAREQVAAQARELALDVGGRVALRVMLQYKELEFLASAIGDSGTIDARTRGLLAEFAARHPELLALTVQSADGARLLWSTNAELASRPLSRAAGLQPLPGHPDLLLGSVRQSRRFATEVIAMRYRVRSAEGTVRYFIDSPYRVDELLPTLAASRGWRVVLRDTRDGRSIVGEPQHAGAQPIVRSEREPVHALPLAVEVGWTQARVWRSYSRGLGWRLAGRSLVLALVALATAIIARMRRRQANLQRQHNSLLANAYAGVVMVRYPDSVIVEANAAIGRIFGLNDVSRAIGRTVPDLLPALARAPLPDLTRHALRDGEASARALDVRRLDDTPACVDLSGRRVDDGGGGATMVVWTIVEVTEREQLQRRLERLALVDPLTDLPNRRALERHLEQAIRRAGHQGSVVAVGLADLDDFKPVNDRYGHEVGDALLRQLGERLQALMRGDEMVARLGGDEFVLVIEDLDPRHAPAQLDAALERLHGAVQTPFELGAGRSARVGLSMGVVLAPVDGEVPDALLRKADETMYRIKHQKATRSAWWLLSGANADEEVAEPPFDPFGSDARQLLGQIREVLDAVGQGFVDTLYDELLQQTATRAILAALSPARIERLRDGQRRHLRFLLDADTTAAHIRDRARGLGVLHALVGVTPAWLAAAMQLLRELLGWHLDSSGHHARARYRLLRVVDARLQMDLQGQLDAMLEVQSAYNAYLARPAPGPGQAWAEVIEGKLQALARLPGIQGSALQRPDSSGILAVQASAGTHAERIAQVLSTPGLESALDPDSPNGRGPAAQAWRTEAITTAADYEGNPALEPWRQTAAELGIRSMAAIPLRRAGQTDSVLLLYGAYPGQFDTEQAHTFLLAVQNRWNLIDDQLRRRQPLVRQQDADAYRQLLYAGGLRMHVQPVVQLHDGSLRKVEALARLVGRDGGVIAPGAFLPALRDADLDALFRMGLMRSLELLAQWRADGLDVEISLNLPPSTLLHPDCADWVGEALGRHALPPDRLTLELLETQEVDEARRDAAITALKRLGVQLAIDDLGSGFSSLKRLASLPFDVIKVDQALVLDIGRDPIKALSLIRTIVQIGRDFEKEVIVEGVENAAIIEAVTTLGATHGQGYGIARPMPAEDFPDWAARRAGGGTAAASAGPARTALGALAYHWMHMHEAPVHRCADVETCVLSAFLRDCGLADVDQAMRWHERVHAVGDADSRRAASQQLSAWLAAHVAH